MQLLFVRLGIANSYLGVIVAHTGSDFDPLCSGTFGALAGIDRRVELAAESLGASPLTVFRKGTLPLAMPGIASGAVLAFATSLDEVVLTLFVAGPNQRTLARQMFSTIRGKYQSGYRCRSVFVHRRHRAFRPCGDARQKALQWSNLHLIGADLVCCRTSSLCLSDRSASKG